MKNIFTREEKPQNTIFKTSLDGSDVSPLNPQGESSSRAQLSTFRTESMTVFFWQVSHDPTNLLRDSRL